MEKKPMPEKTCHICGSTEFSLFHRGTRDRPEIDVLECKSCRLLFLSSFSHITSDFYAESGMYDFAAPDRDAIRNLEVPDTNRRLQLIRPLTKGKDYADFGCGTGLVLEAMRDEAKSVTAIEPNKAMRNALGEIGILGYASLERAPAEVHFDVISAFHVIEHIADPDLVLNSIFSRLRPGGQIVLEVPNRDDALITLYENEAFIANTSWSCHLFTFGASHLRTLLERAGFRNIEVSQSQRYPLSNHLYWLVKGEPKGHSIWTQFNQPELRMAYEQSLSAAGKCDTLIAIAEK
jgi:SAM-dependent methyltransferase